MRCEEEKAMRVRAEEGLLILLPPPPPPPPLSWPNFVCPILSAFFPLLPSSSLHGVRRVAEAAAATANKEEERGK